MTERLSSSWRTGPCTSTDDTETDLAERVEETTTWPESAIGPYGRLTGRGAEIEYASEDMEVDVLDAADLTARVRVRKATVAALDPGVRSKRRYRRLVRLVDAPEAAVSPRGVPVAAVRRLF